LPVKNLCVQNHIDVIKDYQEDIARVPLDKNRMEQVFVNLFANAIHAMPSGGQLRVKTYVQKAEKNERTVVVEIEDTGTGIPADVLDKLFDPFFTTRRGKGGTGLGLSVARNTIEMHNGKIEIGNKKGGGGAKVTVTFQPQE